ncbi:MAG: hypothetical protein LAP40_24315 [Acidobacteriia bacterium]|nr:hypothetical protein [Terriglobia bacterium]
MSDLGDGSDKNNPADRMQLKGRRAPKDKRGPEDTLQGKTPLSETLPVQLLLDVQNALMLAFPDKVEDRVESLRAARLAEHGKSSRIDLAGPFARQTKVRASLLERAGQTAIPAQVPGDEFAIACGIETS